MPAMTDDHRPRRLELSLTQLLAGAAAAASGAWFASRLGVAGTVVGAALVSATVTVLSAVYAHGVRRTAQRLVQGRQLPNSSAMSAPPASAALPAVELEDAAGYRWGRMALVALAVFATAMVGITAVELATGQPLACAFHDSACTRQTTLVPGRPHRSPSPSPSTPSATPTPSASATPTPTPTPSPTDTPSPSASESTSPSGSTSPTPAGSASPSP